MIGLVTDSASQIPADLASRYHVEVVPVIVTIDGIDHREGTELDAEEFWDRFAVGAPPDITTSQPSPGEIAAVYRRLAAAGAEEIVSVHVGSEHSGTVNGARVAAATVDVPVRVVDTGTASFGVTCCVWEAGEVIAAGGSADDAAARAAEVAPSVGTAFILQALDFARRGGRFDESLTLDGDGVMVISGYGSNLDVVGAGHSVDELCDLMVAPFLAAGPRIRAGVCLADPATLPFTEGIEARLRGVDVDVDLVRYRVGPSIAAHTGPGTAGGFWYPVGDR